MSVEVKGRLPEPRASVLKAIAEARELPRLDIGPFLAGEPNAREQLAADVRAIQETLGFYTIVNHGIPQEVIEATYRQSRLLFGLPEEVRLKGLREGHMQGYWPHNSTSTVRPGFEDQQNLKSNLAGWTFLRERSADDPKVVGNMRHRACNKWPDEAVLPEFKETFANYQKAMLDLARKLLPVYAVALDLPDDYFDADFADCEWYQRSNFYKGGVAAENIVAHQAHSDHSFLTLLPISPVPGLQVRSPDGDWIKVAYDPGVIVVNTGEWLNQLTNGRFLATPHRVSQPAEDRISIPFFLNPNDEAMNDPVPGSIKPGESRAFPRVSWHEFFVGFVDRYTLPT